MFENKNVDILPKHQPYNYAIKLQYGTQSLFGPIYNLSSKKLGALRQYIDKNLSKNIMSHSKSPAEAPILFVKKRMNPCRCSSTTMT